MVQIQRKLFQFVRPLIAKNSARGDQIVYCTFVCNVVLIKKRPPRGFGGMRDGQLLRDAGLAGFLGGMTG